jgi:hypothetical protein
MWLGINRNETFLDHMDWEGETRGQMLVDFCESNGL